VFLADDGRSFVPTARRIWDLLLTESVTVHRALELATSAEFLTRSRQAAERQGEQLFSGLVGEFQTWVEDEKARAKTAYDARMLAIGRVGLPAVRDHRRARLNREHDRRISSLQAASSYTPDLAPLLVLRLEGKGAAS
jgi:hypothetical protein